MNLDQALKKYRLSKPEYDKICELLGRAPEGVEWALFSSLWSEHCSYKSSKVFLKKLFRKSPRVLEAEGENAGVVDLGQGERIAFKMESHNHPSFIVPYEGAATGVGGILRDIFTMGARPIALADYLCFGNPTAPRMKALVDGVVRGIAGYGNCVGVPTITGQTEFHSSYNENILVNAMAVGLFRPGEKVYLSQARGRGNHVVYVGAKTGRDGVHGASMASESFDEDSESKRPTVQIGDPFFEKLLIESCLEVMREDLVVAIQDMGAAGLTSSSFEMASKGQVGFDLHLNQVPLRDATITPEEILLSESQERMLLICEPAKFERLQSIFHKWELEATVIGEVTDSKLIRLFWHKELLTALDPDLLVENAPVYNRPFTPYQSKSWVKSFSPETSEAGSAHDQMQSLLSAPEACSREWIFNQYDQRVGAQTMRDCTEPVAVLRLPDSKRALSMALGCRPYVMRMDARLGGADSVIYPALELATKGFEALALTDCLNFGNPENPETMGEFVAALEGLNGACEALEIPIISGNVSFYNETLGRGISPTPSTGLVGLKESLLEIPRSSFAQENLQIYFLSTPAPVLSSGYFAELHKQTPELQGNWNLQAVKGFLQAVRGLVREVPVQASRVVGKFGLAYTLFRMCDNQVGCSIELPKTWETMPQQLALFGESFYAVLVAVKPEDVPKFQAFLAQNKAQLGAEKIGLSGGQKLVIKGKLETSLADLAHPYDGGWSRHFEELA